MQGEDFWGWCKMGKLIDLTGQKFGRWTVLYQTIPSPKKGVAFWHCVCECGNEKDVRSVSLRNGDSTSCGCRWKEWTKKSKNRKDSIIGQKFYFLTVLDRTNKNASNGEIIWKCQCDCGNIHYASTSNLKNGSVKSCGCLISQGEQLLTKIFIENNIKYTKQKIFSDCVNPKTNCLLRFDFYLPEYNCCIEYDGEQHFKEKNTWYTQEEFKELKERDSIKNQYCKNNNIKLIRIPYYDYNFLCWDYINKKISNANN